jgi:AraC-like DNA-binding protein/mannose-6-phosphate isomerase-like protein (cupin superfamily)
MSTHQYILAQSEGGDQDAARQRFPSLLYVTNAHYSQEWGSQLHSHTCSEMFFITGGNGAFLIREGRFPVAINDLVVVDPGVPHTETSQNGSPMEYVVLGVEGLEAAPGGSGYALLHLFAEDAVSSCLRTLVQESRDPRSGCDQICQRLLEIVLLRLRRRDDFALSSGAPSVPGISRECSLVRQYIDNHFKENLSLDQLAELAHVNKYYLAHSFRREYNTSPISYLISRRIRESRFLLAETDHTLSQIAQILGFSSLSYFSQSFRRIEGMSPMEYRRGHRNMRGGH